LQDVLSNEMGAVPWFERVWANLLPLCYPALAHIIHVPCIRRGMACSWMELGFFHPSVAAASASWVHNPRASKASIELFFSASVSLSTSCFIALCFVHCTVEASLLIYPALIIYAHYIGLSVKGFLKTVFGFPVRLPLEEFQKTMDNDTRKLTRHVHASCPQS